MYRGDPQTEVRQSALADLAALRDDHAGDLLVAASGADQVAAIRATAIILLGGIGYALDEWQGTSPWFLFGGLVLGMTVGFYELAKTIWRP